MAQTEEAKSGKIGNKDAEKYNGQKGYDKEAVPHPVHKQDEKE